MVELRSSICVADSNVSKGAGANPPLASARDPDNEGLSFTLGPIEVSVEHLKVLPYLKLRKVVLVQVLFREVSLLIATDARFDIQLDQGSPELQGTLTASKRIELGYSLTVVR